MRSLPAAALPQLGVFSTRQASRGGWTRSALHNAVRSGRLRSLRVGVYQCADPDAEFGEAGPANRFERARWEHAGEGVAAALAVRGATASHSTAAVLNALSLLRLPARACVTVAGGWTCQLHRVHLHRVSASAMTPVHRVGGLDVFGVERTALDLAREYGVLDGVVALDHGLNRGLITTASVHEELARMSNWPGVRNARVAAEAADGRSESVLETRSRLALPEHGVPRPVPQVSLGNSWGGFVGRPDFYWDEFGVAGEVDGALKYSGAKPDALLREKRRQEELEELGVIVVRWDRAGVERFDLTAQRLFRAFSRGAANATADRRWTVLPDSVRPRHVARRS